MKKLLISLLLPALLSGCWKDNDPVNPTLDAEFFNMSSGVVSYDRYQPLKDKPVKIHYHIPSHGDVKTMPILFVMHGIDRNAASYLNAWKNAANERGFMVFALEFSKEYYPSDTEYTQGGMYKSSTLKPEQEWTFSIIEPIFNFIVSDLKSKQNRFDIWGHSAGAQFVHRFVLFKPAAKINRAVSANAGWYTLPDFAVDFPYGLKGSTATTVSLGTSFVQTLIVQLGTADIIRDDNLNTSAGAEAQGKNRYERGGFFWNIANQKKAPYPTFNWQKCEVKGIAHESAKMAVDAAGFLY